MLELRRAAARGGALSTPSGSHVALIEPEIPGNTGNIIRLCANTGAQLHLVEPLGFSLEDRLLRRAGLDYHEYTRMHVHRDFATLRAALPQGTRWVAYSAHGTGRHTDWQFADGDVLVFGPETRGLTPAQRNAADACLRIPMREGVRSLNLSNAVAIAVYEAWRQRGFDAHWCET